MLLKADRRSKSAEPPERRRLRPMLSAKTRGITSRGWGPASSERCQVAGVGPHVMSHQADGPAYSAEPHGGEVQVAGVGPRDRLRDDKGVALLIALMATLLLTALGSALVLLTQTETAITSNYRNAEEALYSADAGIERVVQDLLTVARWSDALTGTLRSSFADTSMTPTMPDGTVVDLTAATTNLQNESDAQNLWGPNNPRWRLYAFGPVNNLLPTGTINSFNYIAVWVADDPSETDGNPLADVNGVLSLRAEAYGPSNAKKVVEATMARTTSTEIERGMIAQRGQEELNQRSRKAAVQTPGTTLERKTMNTATGGM